MSRHQDALMIQEGICNPRDSARALVRAIDEATVTDHDAASNDPAVRLILAQLVWVLYHVELYNLIATKDNKSVLGVFSDDYDACQRARAGDTQ